MSEIIYVIIPPGDLESDQSFRDDLGKRILNDKQVIIKIYKEKLNQSLTNVKGVFVMNQPEVVRFLENGVDISESIDEQPLKKKGTKARD